MRRLPYIAGLSRIRFFLACWVVVSHVPFPWLPEKSSPLSSVLRLFLNNFFCGVAAVIAFFLISGLCIHFPYRHSLAIDPGKNLLRRSLRIGLPLIVVLLVGKRFDILRVPIWSIYCEEIYYFLYPLFIAGRKRWGSWRPHLALALAGSAGLIFMHPEYKNYWENGPLLTWLLGLPCWLLGCLLAEKADALAIDSAHFSPAKRIWAWRAGAVAISTALSVLRFHSGLGYPLTLTIFAFYLYAWLEREIVFYNQESAPRPERIARALEAGGRWSYSLYLVHEMTDLALRKFALLASLQPQAAWFLRIGIIFGCAYLFHRLVERPSHELSRKIRAEKVAPSEDMLATPPIQNAVA